MLPSRKQIDSIRVVNVWLVVLLNFEIIIDNVIHHQWFDGKLIVHWQHSQANFYTTAIHSTFTTPSNESTHKEPCLYNLYCANSCYLCTVHIIIIIVFCIKYSHAFNIFTEFVILFYEYQRLNSEHLLHEYLSRQYLCYRNGWCISKKYIENFSKIYCTCILQHRCCGNML